ncbi:MAG TPA: hypothetical protein VGM92_13550 [Candidatus Kapabacteria bacterium]|jgi:hypothetical protein
MKFRLFLFFLIAGTLFGASDVATRPAMAQSNTANVNTTTVNTSTAKTPQEQTIRHALIQKIEELKYAKIKERLGLDDATAEKFFAVYKPAEKDIQALVMERNAELKALAVATNTTTADADVGALTAKIKDLNTEIESHEQGLQGSLSPLLTPLQQAKLLVFEHEFNQHVREQVERQTARAELRALHQQIHRQRIKNQLLKKKAAEKEGDKR